MMMMVPATTLCLDNGYVAIGAMYMAMAIALFHHHCGVLS